MKVVVAKHAGVCYGVKRALQLANEACENSNEVHSLGPLIHNPQAVADLSEAGVQVANEASEVSEGTLIIRSHGVPPQVIREAESRGIEVVDATCPHVTKAQESAQRLRDEGYTVVIVGEPNHPEIIGIRAYAGDNALVISDVSEVPTHIRGRKVGVVVQTTQLLDSFQKIISQLIPLVGELKIFNTICNATSQRQGATAELASQVDVVIVVGGKNSGNTARLAEISSRENERTYLVETPDELKSEWFKSSDTVGIAAGASTPDKQIGQVKRAIEKMDCSRTIGETDE